MTQNCSNRSAPAERAHVFPGCMDCLLKLAGDAARMAAPENESVRFRAEAEARRVIESADPAEVTSPELANRAFRLITGITGVTDPYRAVKREEMELARRTVAFVRDRLGDDLGSLLRLAVLGNSLDFFLPPVEAFPRVRQMVMDGFSFFHDDTDRLAAFLETGPEQILYLTDNAGEIYFDRPLYRYLKRKARRVVLVVKGGPGLNDLTRGDLERGGLMTDFEDVSDTGTDGAGVDWEYVSGEFLSLLEDADLVLAKGMANFETLSARPLTTPAFFLFKAKCVPIQDFLGAPPESFWALWRDASDDAGGRDN